ncbi:hypothetical protein V1512DRAFT_262048 [Lipomyces arxii]|uniref:uncharacterized protein n=1 Tax=Lipomyces arxii TaxID=56418 RepID=UPI0034CF1B65
MSVSTAVHSALSSSPFKPGRDYNHADDQEYRRLRDLAQNEYNARLRLLDQAHVAYQSGDGAEAKKLSELGKQHGDAMDLYNAQAAAFVFRANNADSDEDEIDLHGLYVKEAEEYLTQRIAACKARNESHLEVIVGKGNHSSGGISKLKPAVERLCRENHFQYGVDDDNSGVIIINFKQSGGKVPMSQLPVAPKHNFAQNIYYYPSPQQPQASYRPNKYDHQGQLQYGGSYPGMATYPGHPQQKFEVEQPQQQQNDGFMNLLKMCLKQCCAVM